MQRELIFIAEIAELMNVTQRTARDRKVTDPSFPRPAFQTSNRNRGWRRAEVLAYLGLEAEPQSAEPSRGSTSAAAG